MMSGLLSVLLQRLSGIESGSLGLLDLSHEVFQFFRAPRCRGIL
jgi:hypothetical protein